MTNEAQRQRWNAESQATTWPKRERLTTAVTPLLLKALAPQPGEKIVEIGSGGGLAAIAAAGAVGPTGSVVGFDLSEPLVRLATQRAADAKCGNVTFVAGDAQVDAIPGAPFDAAMSQFGVMFFADPVAAFSHIRKCLKGGGRLVFACWQGAAKNSWFPLPVFAKYQPPPQPSSHGGPPPSPFAFADPAYVENILIGAGFRDVSYEPLSIDVTVPEDSVFDRDSIGDLPLDGERREQAWQDLLVFRAPLLGADGQLHITLAPQIFSARNA